ncbi:MAG: sugar phosphate isomerase/epimerase family protein [Planctomycetia bacterium]|nr:sugar phosphate isomerase/epimerase family protein [Planctomycetia bacterium]
MSSHNFVLSTSSSAYADESKGKYHTELHNAVIVGEIKAEEIEALAAAGVEGVESTATQIDVAQAREARNICQANGIKIHSVMRSAMFNHPSRVEEDIKALKHALRIASAYGASSCLCVPGRVDAPAIKPHDFRIKFDPTTCMVSEVVDGDNAPFASYIEAQNNATRCAQRYVPEVAAVAAYEGIRIGLENVWNNLWCAPELYAAFIHSFQTPWVKSYFDLGNHVKYAPTQDWLRALGKNSIVKLHFKDYLIDPNDHNSGRFVPVGLGSNDWALIRQTLDDIDYSGFVTIEFEEALSRKYTPAQNVRKFKNFFNGVDLMDGVELIQE